MGLDTTPECYAGTYSGFTFWRHAVAEAAGYAIWPVMIEYGGGSRVPHDTIMLDWGHIEDKNYMGEWTPGTEPRDPLVMLFCHSDCEGVIHSQHAHLIANRLEQILPNIPDMPENHRGYTGPDRWRELTQRFIDGLRQAVREQRDVEFH